ncbi:MAG: hypothetical protein JW820_16410, partial [Spirochaetales bacterium]|nr:hypothetical protein [Spirochaetales bacterium]
RRVLYENVRRVVSKGSPPIIVPTAFGPARPLTGRFFARLAGLTGVPGGRAYQRLPLSRRRYLARVG